MLTAAKFRSIIRVTKKYTDKKKNRPYTNMQRRFYVAFLTYFFKKSVKILYRQKMSV